MRRHRRAWQKAINRRSRKPQPQQRCVLFFWRCGRGLWLLLTKCRLFCMVGGFPIFQNPLFRLPPSKQNKAFCIIACLPHSAVVFVRWCALPCLRSRLAAPLALSPVLCVSLVASRKNIFLPLRAKKHFCGRKKKILSSPFF